MTSDQEPRYRLVDADGNIVGSLYGKADGSVAIQETDSGADREVALAPDGTFSAPSVETESVSTDQLTSTDGSVFGHEIDTDSTTGSGSDDLEVSVDDISDYSRLLLICEYDVDTDDTVELVLNGDDDGGVYGLTLNDGTRKSEQDTWGLFTCTDSMVGTFVIEFVPDRDSRPMPIRLGVTQRSSGSNRIDDMAVNFQGIPGSPGTEWDIGLRTVATEGDANVTLYGAEQ